MKELYTTTKLKELNITLRKIHNKHNPIKSDLDKVYCISYKNGFRKPIFDNDYYEKDLIKLN